MTESEVAAKIKALKDERLALYRRRLEIAGEIASLKNLAADLHRQRYEAGLMNGIPRDRLNRLEADRATIREKFRAGAGFLDVLSTRARGVLEQEGWLTPEAVLSIRVTELMKAPNAGKVSVAEIRMAASEWASVQKEREETA